MTAARQDSVMSSEEADYERSPVQAVVTLTTVDGVLIDRIELRRADLDESNVNMFRGSLGERLTEEARNHGGRQ